MAHAFVVRVWLPDRPGALGQVASRIGAVRGDVVSIEILERGAGRAIDELVVSLPDEGLVELLVAEIAQVDGVDVEDVRPRPDPDRDTRLEALETAARMAEADDAASLMACLLGDAAADFAAEWAVVVDLDAVEARAVVGEAPAPGWLAAFIHGSRHSEAVASGESGPEDVAWAPMGSVGLELVVGRRGRPFRARERRALGALARIAGARLAALGEG